MPTLSYSVYVHIAILKLLFQKVFICGDKVQDKNSLFASFFLSKILHFIENYKINIKSLANDCISNFCIYWIERTEERTKKKHGQKRYLSIGEEYYLSFCHRDDLEAAQ